MVVVVMAATKPAQQLSFSEFCGNVVNYHLLFDADYAFADISTEKTTAEQSTRFSVAHAQENRQERTEAAPGQRAEAFDRLRIRRFMPVRSMTPTRCLVRPASARMLARAAAMPEPGNGPFTHSAPDARFLV